MAANKFTKKWNVPANCWVVDIATEEGTPVLCGIPLVTGADLLEQFGYLGFGGQLIAVTDNARDTPPTFSNLGITGHMYYIAP